MLTDHIIAFSEGHISLKHDAFHDPALAKKIVMLLRFYPGVKKADLDKDAGTLDINYDATRLTKDKVMDLLAQGESWLVSSK